MPFHRKLKPKKATVPFSRSLGEYIQKTRKKQGLSQIELAKKIGSLKYQNISNWEQGSAGPSFENFVKLCEALNVPESEMLRVLNDEQNKIFKREIEEYKTRN